jgi:hypothetical protein
VREHLKHPRGLREALKHITPLLFVFTHNTHAHEHITRERICLKKLADRQSDRVLDARLRDFQI